MAETHNRLLVDVNAEVVDIITAVQEDTNSRYLDVVLYNNGVPVNLTGHEVRIYLRKPETGQEVWNNGEITDAVKGRCQFLMTTQALAEVGYLKAQISIWKDNTEILSTQIFNILVTKSLRTTGSIESSNEYGALVVLFQNLYEAHALMTKMVESFGEAGKIATGIAADTFWKMLEAVYQVNADALKNASVSEVLDRIGTTSDMGGSTIAGTAMAKLNELLKINPAMEAFLRTGGIFSKNIEFASYGGTFSFTEAGQTKSTKKTLTEDFYITCAYSNRAWSNVSSALSVTYEVNSVTFNVPTEREYQNGYGLYTITGLQTYMISGTIEAPPFNLFPIPIYRVAKAGTVLKFEGKANHVPSGEEKASIYLYGFYIR